MTIKDDRSQTTDDTPIPRGFMDALLKLCRHGLPASLLRDVMTSQGIDGEVAASVIRNGLDIGSVELGHNLNIVRSE